MSKKMILVLVGIVCLAGAVIAGEQMIMPTVETPNVYQFLGQAQTALGATRYPEFFKYSSDNPSCGEYLKRHYPNGKSLAPLPGKQLNSYTIIPGLAGSIDIPDEYRRTAKVLVTWSVRCEGFKGGAYTIWPALCSPWHGTSWQRFVGGDVKTRLYVNGNPKGDPHVLTVPTGGSGTNTVVTHQAHDPTLTGSQLITAEDFEGNMLPTTLNLQVRWYNDTCMRIVSPANMRNMIVTLIPVEG